ncbi:glycine betaine ABC transporter substrate-binding protein [Tenuibacillus multivorans]|uniref:Glycine betaine/proline transport system substrate-binding protein n=1 Tax=Tenuibacillus multivorans TaxID=237069 RepID=A0A1G9WPD2_9BACI|nr:glycine betaine ABC transporter substrate-binding protein [Tenuibacillus multivorans]GEL77998.1 ABC transporter substrate-binding protein [Tenuibacillus multivorans]SDM85925.1 glycine betaine/proline transport system substrate-binding protein [Tenuibacillus multivorans]
MKKFLTTFMFVTVLVLAACGSQNEDSENGELENETKEKETIVFGQTTWTSTKAPTQIAKQILEEAGYEVEIKLLDQPIIWEGLKTEEIDIFMDAWLPYTEEALWEKYKGDLQKVATSYEEVPLGWVVPEYVDAETIDDLAGQADKFDGEVLTIGEGAGIVSISKEVMQDENYNLDGYELVPSSEAAMMGVMENKFKNEEPFIITGWRPHSMFAKYDLKFLEDTQEHFKYDNVYVLSYKGLEDKHPEVYDILSEWSIEVSDLEEMMNAYQENDKSFEDSAAEWIEENRDTVDEWLGK